MLSACLISSQVACKMIQPRWSWGCAKWSVTWLQAKGLTTAMKLKTSEKNVWILVISSTSFTYSMKGTASWSWHGGYWDELLCNRPWELHTFFCMTCCFQPRGTSWGRNQASYWWIVLILLQWCNKLRLCDRLNSGGALVFLGYSTGGVLIQTAPQLRTGTAAKTEDCEAQQPRWGRGWSPLGTFRGPAKLVLQ